MTSQSSSIPEPLPVVVGVDGSESSDRALVWAEAEARWRAVPLRVVHAFPPTGAVDGRAPDIQTAAQRLLDMTAGSVALATTPVSIDTALLEGTPTRALVDESARSGLLVLGTRGHGGFVSLRLGSTAVGVTAHAQCPVAVVPDRDRAPAADLPVVVGVDFAAGSQNAVEFAFARARERGLGLVAVHVWHPPTAYGAYAATDVLRFDAASIQREAHIMLTEALARGCERYPEVEVDQRVLGGQAVAELVRAADTAEAVVVGARGRSALTGMVLGSVSQGLLHHAKSPVIVVR